MIEFSCTQEFTKFRNTLNGTVGFIPTMGALHDGHVSLIKKSLNTCDHTIVSIFVNPIQFAINEDLHSYPRPIEKDLKLLKNLNITAVFIPSHKDMYQKNHSTFIEENDLTKNLEGTSRPHFFKGVLTIVTKLFNMTRPTHSFFGEKDAQQLCVIKKLVVDLNFPINIIACPTVRDENGLALSSRNQYLEDETRKRASIIYLALMKAKHLVESGEKNPHQIKKTINSLISTEPLATIDYISIADSNSLEEIKKYINTNVLISLAIYIRDIRLIDNISLFVD